MHLKFFRTIKTTASFFKRHSKAWTVPAILFVVFSSFAESIGLMMFFPLIQPDNDLVHNEGGFFSLVFSFFASFGLGNDFFSVIVIITLVFIARAFFMLIAFSLLSIMRRSVSISLKASLIDTVSRIHILTFSVKESGYFASLIGQHSSRATESYAALIEVYVRVAQALVFLAVAFYISYEIGLVSVVSGVLVFLLFRSLNSKTRETSIALAQSEETLNVLSIPFSNAQKYLRATGRLVSKREQLEQESVRVADGHGRSAFLNGIMVAIKEPLAVFFLIVVLVVQVEFFSQEVGLVLVSLVLYYRVMMAMMLTQTYYQILLSLEGSVNIIQKFFETNRIETIDEAKVQKNKKFENEIRFENVTFSYPESKAPALKEVSLSIKRYSSVGIVGASGSGKSTLIDLITLVLKPTTGSIVIDGIDSDSLMKQNWNNRIGYVTQDNVLFDSSLFENIVLGTDADNVDWDWFKKVIEITMLSELVARLPKGTDTQIGPQGAMLSGGQRQRVFLARELYRKPDLLILDEATSALDSKTEYDIRNSLQSILGKVTIVAVAHRLSTIKNFDKIIVLNDGEIIEVGSYKELSKKKESHLNSLSFYQEL